MGCACGNCLKEASNQETSKKISEEDDNNIYLNYNSFDKYYKSFEDIKAKIKDETSFSLDVFLVSTKSVPNFIGYIKYKKLNEKENLEKEKIKIYYDYEQCYSISQKADEENEFIILDANCMIDEINNFKKLKDKIVIFNFNNKKKNYKTKIIFEKNQKEINIKENDKGFYCFINDDIIFNPDTVLIKK